LAKSGWVGEWQSIIRVKLDPILFKVEMLLAAIRAVNWSQRDRQAQVGDPGRDRLATPYIAHHDVETLVELRNFEAKL
jgi:hypothetical protein